MEGRRLSRFLCYTNNPTLAYIHTYVDTYLRTYLLTYLLTYLPTYLLNSEHSCYHSCCHYERLPHKYEDYSGLKVAYCTGRDNVYHLTSIILFVFFVSTDILKLTIRQLKCIFTYQLAGEHALSTVCRVCVL